MTTVAVRKLDSPLKRWKQYPSLRESGADWVSRIPSHWRAGRIRYVARLESGHTPSRQHPEYWSDCTIPWFTLADVWQLRDGSKKYVSETAERISELGLANSSARLLPEGTVILSRTASVGFTGILDRPMATSQDFVNWICGPRILPEYLWYVFRGMRQEFERLMMGSTHQTIYMPQVQSFATPIPTIPEQRAIVRFLDRETAKIDTLISDRQRLIELLQEKRTALISHAVTKGMNGLGDSAKRYTEMWTETRLGRTIKLQRGFDITGAADGMGDIPVISSGGFSGQCSIPIVRGPGVIVGRKGTLGTVHFCEGDFWPHDTTLWVRAFKGNHPRFVYYFLLHMRLESYDVGAANPTLNRNHVHPVIVRWRDVESQRRIAQYLDRASEAVDPLIAKVNEAIVKLSEYSTALISAAVTGKIDVRGEAE